MMIERCDEYYDPFLKSKWNLICMRLNVNVNVNGRVSVMMSNEI